MTAMMESGYRPPFSKNAGEPKKEEGDEEED
jgi:hypothetical protein